MSDLPSIQFYPGDRLRELMPILADSEAVGAWCKAWMYLWGSGPSKPETVAQVAGKGWDKVGFLFREIDGLLSLEWMEQKRVETAAFRARQTANGKKGGRPKSTSTKRNNPSLSNGLTQVKAKKSPRVEGEGEEGTRGTKKERARIEYPKWAGPNTQAKWEEFKAYKLEEFKDRYASVASEQRAVNLLAKWFTSGRECVDAIDEAMGRKWRFPVDPAKRLGFNATEKADEFTLVKIVPAT